VETLYVDVVNQGLQYSLEGVGPATWVTGIIDGRSVLIGGEEYFVEVIDYRDGDRIPNEEIAIPRLLDSTAFIYRSDSGVLPEFEGRMRSVLQALPDEVSGPPDGVPVPDLWVVLGRAEGST
jgi:hypothetical protein